MGPSVGVYLMWLLFVVVFLANEQVVDYASFGSKQACEAGKAQLYQGLAAELPQAQLSLTCFKLNKPEQPV